MIIFSIITIAIIIYFFIFNHRNKKNESIFTDVNIGHRCYSCKKIASNRAKLDYIMFDNRDLEEKLCKCNECKREDKLHLLIKGSFYKIYLSKLKRELYRRGSKLIPILLIIHFVFLAIYAISMLFNVEYFIYAKYVYPPLLLIAWILILFRAKLSYMKKPSY